MVEVEGWQAEQIANQLAEMARQLKRLEDTAASLVEQVARVRGSQPTRGGGVGAAGAALRRCPHLHMLGRVGHRRRRRPPMRDMPGGYG